MQTSMIAPNHHVSGHINLENCQLSMLYMRSKELVKGSVLRWARAVID